MTVERPLGGKTWCAVLCLVILTAACFRALVIHPGDILVGPQRGGFNDLTTAFLAYRGFVATAQQRDGEFPAWNPHWQCGLPWFDNPQSAMLYPPNWIGFLLPTGTALSWLLVAHHFFAGAGCFVLCRHYGFSRLASLLSGSVFLAAPYLLAHTGEGHYNQICVVAWVPWTLLAYERFKQGRRGSAAVLAGALAIGFTAGHVQELFYLVLILTTFVLLDVWTQVRGPVSAAGEDAGSGLATSPRDGKLCGRYLRALRLLPRWGLVGCLTGGLVAVQLVPTLTYTLLTVRSGGLTVEQAGVGLRLVDLWQVLNPMALGGPEGYDYYCEKACYFGILPLLLGVCGAVFAWRRYPVQRMTWVGLLSLAFAFGTSSPVFVGLYWLVPGLGSFRAPSRALFFCAFSLAVLAGAGCDVVLRRLRPASGAAQGRRISWLFRIPRPSGSGVAGAVLILLGAVELSVHAGVLLRTISRESVRNDSPIVRVLGRDATHSRVLAPQSMLSDREAVEYNLFKVQGYEPVPLHRYGVAFAAMVSDEEAFDRILGFVSCDPERIHKPLADMLGVRYAVVESDEMRDIAGWRLVSQGRVDREFLLRGARPRSRPYSIYENETVFPRAFVVGHAQTLGGDEFFIQTLPKIDFRHYVLLERDVLPPGQRTGFQAARIVRYTPNRVDVEVELSDPGYLVLSDVFHSGWSATDNGGPAAILPANAAFRAVPLSAGRHRVSFQYTPPFFFVGAVISLLTAGMIAAWLGRSWVRSSIGRAKSQPKLGEAGRVPAGPGVR